MSAVNPPPMNKAIVSVDPNTSIYADGDLVGEKLTLAVPASGIIETITLIDQAKQNAALDLIFFIKNPSATTFTDNAALDVADADALNIIGAVRIAASDYVDLADNSVACLRGVGLGYVSDAGSVLYACFVSNGATPTYAATTDLQLVVVTIPDTF